MFVRHSTFQPTHPAILWIHAIGDSSLCFLEAFARPELNRFNLVAPDMLGFGRSSAAADGDYSFDTQIRRLWAVLDHCGFDTAFIVGHSMGGDIATAMAAGDENRRLIALINAEGNLTPDDLFISSRAVDAAERGDFDRWLKEEFMEATVLKTWGHEWLACRRYYASLWFCRPAAFLASAKELCERNAPAPGSPFSLTGAQFVGLSNPKMYCWSSESVSSASRSLLDRIPNVGFDNSFHWMMIDSENSFYRMVDAFFARHRQREADA